MNTYSLFFDGAIILIVLISAWRGKRKGIVDTTLKLLGLLAAIFLAVTFTNIVAKFLSGTIVRELVHAKVLESLGGSSSDMWDGLPDFIGNSAESLTVKGKELLASSYTDSILTILSFLGILVLVWLSVTIIRYMARKGKESSKIIGSLDSLSGMTLGLCKGAIVSCLLVALIVPITTVISPLKLHEVITGLKNSIIAGWIYETNPLFVLVSNIIYK